MRFWLPILLFSVAASQQCGGAAPASQTPEQPVHDAGILSTLDARTDLKLGQEECELLFEHIFEIAFSNQRSGAKADEQATEADLEKAKAQVRDELLSQCVGAGRQDFHYDCALAATDVGAIQACMQ